MNWFHLITKGHKILTDLVARMNTWEQRDANLVEAVKDNFAAEREGLHKDNEELRARLAESAKLAIGALVASGKESESRVGKFLADQEKAVTAMVADANGVEGAVEKLLRREREFEARIDARCREIGEKVRDSLKYEMEQALKRARELVAELEAKRRKSDADFSGRLAAHSATADRKVNLLAKALTDLDEKLTASVAEAKKLAETHTHPAQPVRRGR